MHDEGRPTNRLAAATSAYLRQHMRNPVDWHAWGPEALERARAEEKPLLVSIGYSACHWCHVMERESFEDAETAALMNRLTVPIKVDREERPDVDRIYMDFVVRTTRPFFGGTYYPPEPRHGLPSFRQLLDAIGRAWATQRGEVEESASQVVAQLARRPQGVASQPPGAHSAAAAATTLLGVADETWGGFGGAPKFPTPTSLDALLAGVDVLPPAAAQPALHHVVHTCREMSRRGLFDHLGGGFHRYCVDATWTIPHFEKMLYDQGQLLRVYADAWRRTGVADDDLVWPIRETVGYLRREMAAPDGGWFASQDADSEGEEGRFYVWTPAQVGAVLGARADAFCAAYGVTDSGNFEHATTHLVDHARRPRAAFAEERAALLAARARRVAPATDRKRVTSWNAWLASGLARAGSLLGDASMLADAVATADFLGTRARDEKGRLAHVYDEGRATAPGFLEDAAALLEALLDLHRAGAGERHLDAALALADDVVARFFDADENDLFLTPSDGERLVHRPRAEPDGATPNAAGAAALALVRVAALAGREDLARVVQRVLRTNAYLLERGPEAFPSLARAAALAERGVAVAVIVGEPGDAATEALAGRARHALAFEDAVVVVAPGAAPPASLDADWVRGRDAVGGRATAYLCRGTTCSLPVSTPDALASLVAEP
jgi:uncharacterized protein YyaL (SSP411 family)